MYNLLTILGPTACGKTRFAANFSSVVDGEIISADSRQVYRKMDIGTGKDYDDYIIDGKRIPYHLVDIAEPGYRYNVYEFQNDFLKAFNDITARGKFPVLCGGTGLYIEAVTKGYRLISVPVDQNLRDGLEHLSMDKLADILKSYKNLHNTTEILQRKRLIRAIEIEKYYKENDISSFDYPSINCLFTGINIDVETRRKRITSRLRARIENGMIEEVRQLLVSGLTKDDMFYYGLEYKFITQYLTGEFDLETMINKLEIAIHQFAKRQMTWFRGMERRGLQIFWIDGNDPYELNMAKIIEKLKS